MIRLDVDVIFFTYGNDRFTNSLGTGSICCLGKCRTMYKFTCINVRIVLACRIHVRVLSAFRCKPGFIKEHTEQYFGGRRCLANLFGVGEDEVFHSVLSHFVVAL